MTEAVAAIHGRRLDARYTLLEKLGAGGQGEVWRAHDETRGIDVALKILTGALAKSEAAWAALEHEHGITSRLDHPGILKVFPPERSGDTIVLPMELASGGDLRRLRGAGYLEIIPVLIEVAQALEHAHERGVVHRDLKPGNVLFDSRGRVRLADFGVAGMTSGPAPGQGKQGLSPFTASPEQLRGEVPAPSDDIYGLGALAYELLSGYPPYYPHFDAQRAIEEPVPDLMPTRQIPPLLGALVMRMLAKDPQARPRSMREVIDDLDAALNDTLTFEFERVADPAGKRPPSGAQPPLPPALSALSGASGTHKARADTAELGLPIEVEPLGPTGHAASKSSASGSRPPHAAAGPTAAAAPVGAEKAPWEEMKLHAVPRMSTLEPIRARRWPWVVLALLVGAAFGVFYWLPRHAPGTLPIAIDLSALTSPKSSQAPAAPPQVAQPASPAETAPPVSAAPQVDAAAEEQLQAARENFNRRLASLDSRGAGVWGGRDFAAAKTRAAESVGAHDAGNTRMAQERLSEASRLLDGVESRAPQAMTAQLAAGEKALTAGQQELAGQAFELARRIDPNDKRASDGQRRARSLNGVLPLLADAENAETAHNYPRAAQDYSQALSLDPGNVRAKAGLVRANAAFGDDNYARAVGTGFAALGAGRLDEAHDAFEKARSFKANGAEAAEGLRRVGAALTVRGFASIRQRAAGLEAEERWDEAVQSYDAALNTDPSLVFAQQGKRRAVARADLSSRLQALIDRPERLAAASVRDEARMLIDTARAQAPSGPVLRSQLARLEILLPEFDKPVRLSLVSDNATQVAISSIGSFGTFAKREIELKPGKYTVIGTRNGYRDVRREVTVAPGQGPQTISVSCSEPI
jgi:serine/threonine protein kinase